MGGLTVYGTEWCPDCQTLSQFLGAHRYRYQWVDVDHDAGARTFLEQAHGGKQIVPTVVLPDGSVLGNPALHEVAERLGLPAEPQARFADVTIIGAGPAGLSAAIYAAREGLETVVLERGTPGGQAALTDQIENYPGFPEGIGGMELSNQLKAQAERYGVEIVLAEAERIESDGPYRLVRTVGSEEFNSWAVLVAAGSDYRRLGVPGEEELIGRGIHYCATCDAPLYQGEELVAVGGGNTAAEEGVFLTKFAPKVTLLVRGDKVDASKILVDKLISSTKVEVRYHTVVKEFQGDGMLTGIVVQDTESGEEETIHPAGAFIFIGMIPNTQFLGDKIELDDWGFVVTEGNLQTTIPGVFACGDVRAGSTKQVASAVGEGATAALMIREYLKARADQFVA